MQRFFLDNQCIHKDTNKVTIQDEYVNYIKNVLRCNIGEKIEIVSNNEEDRTYLCEIKEINKSYILCDMVQIIKQATEANIHINLIQGLPKSDKMEWIIEKCTELGVNEFTPLKLSRCVVRLDGKEEEKKITRWQKIALSAAEQSKRNKIPIINNIVNINNIFNFIQNYDIVIVAYENEQNRNLKQVLKEINLKSNLKIAIIIGPEGGLEEEEVNRLKQTCNAEVISLGKRILRTETAGLAIVTSIMYESGNFGVA